MSLVFYAVRMEAALVEFGVFPPPAARADVFARRDGTGAGRAADAGVPLGMECIHRHIMSAEVIPDILLRPIGEGIEFLQPVLCIPFFHSDIAPSGRLATAQPGDPGFLTGKRPLQRLHLAQMATFLT